MAGTRKTLSLIDLLEGLSIKSFMKWITRSDRLYLSEIYRQGVPELCDPDQKAQRNSYFTVIKFNHRYFSDKMLNTNIKYTPPQTHTHTTRSILLTQSWPHIILLMYFTAKACAGHWFIAVLSMKAGWRALLMEQGRQQPYFWRNLCIYS